MPINICKEGTEIRVKITPNAKNNAILDIADIGEDKKALRVNIKSVPEDGKANKELINFLSKSWGISKSDIEIISGHSSRIKKLLIKKENFTFKL